MEGTKTGWPAKLSLWIFGFEISTALLAVIWNYSVIDAGEWEELAHGIIDLLIWMGVMLCSLTSGAIAFAWRVKHRNIAGIDLREATWAYILHGAVLIIGLVALWLVFVNKW